MNSSYIEYLFPQFSHLVLEKKNPNSGVCVISISKSMKGKRIVPTMAKGHDNCFLEFWICLQFGQIDLLQDLQRLARSNSFSHTGHFMFLMFWIYNGHAYQLWRGASIATIRVKHEVIHFIFFICLFIFNEAYICLPNPNR